MRVDPRTGEVLEDRRTPVFRPSEPDTADDLHDDEPQLPREVAPRTWPHMLGSALIILGVAVAGEMLLINPLPVVLILITWMAYRAARKRYGR